MASVYPDQSAIDVDAEARAAFLLRLRARGLRDVNVLRAMETAPRHMFTPHRYADLANRDLALPIACGQTMPEPFVAARIVEAARLEPHHRTLEIGTGSGYVTALLARLCVSVVSVERYQTLAIAARERLQRLGFSNAAVLWGDGLRVTGETGEFDRILVHATLDDAPTGLFGALAFAGEILCGRRAPDGVIMLTRLTRQGGEDWRAEPLFPCRLPALTPGLSAAL